MDKRKMAARIIDRKYLLEYGMHSVLVCCSSLLKEHGITIYDTDLAGFLPGDIVCSRCGKVWHEETGRWRKAGA